ncbi:MAG: proline dehydrogenase [Chlorobi bacterium]|nr:proline dehydrogenase [Chlorobiota bacterium]
MSLFNSLVVKILPVIPKSVVGMVARRYIAGEHLDDAIRVVKDLNSHGFMATMDVLGEGVRTEEEVLSMRKQCEAVLHAIDEHKLDANLSIKPTQMGLAMDEDLCYRNMTVLLDIAKSYDNFVRMDMEDHTVTDSTLSVYRRLRESYDNVGVVFQAYLKRTEEDIRKLAPLRPNVRLCKGIYNEPPEIAFKDREEIRESFRRNLHLLFELNLYVGIATHDSDLVTSAYEMISDFDLKKTDYEFQMLLGVREDLREQILGKGHRLRVYVPYGTHWYEYSVRRLKENPRMAGHIAKAFFTGK